LSSELIRMHPTATTGTSKVLVPSFIVFIGSFLLSIGTAFLCNRFIDCLTKA
jgi:hypothetical protein